MMAAVKLIAARRRHANAARRLLALAAIRDRSSRTDAVRVRRYGPSNIARLSPPLERRRPGWRARPSARGAGLPFEYCAAGRIEGPRQSGLGSVMRWRSALAPA